MSPVVPREGRPDSGEGGLHGPRFGPCLGAVRGLGIQAAWRRLGSTGEEAMARDA